MLRNKKHRDQVIALSILITLAGLVLALVFAFSSHAKAIQTKKEFTKNLEEAKERHYSKYCFDEEITNKAMRYLIPNMVRHKSINTHGTHIGNRYKKALKNRTLLYKVTHPEFVSLGKKSILCSAFIVFTTTETLNESHVFNVVYRVPLSVLERIVAI